MKSILASLWLILCLALLGTSTARASVTPSPTVTMLDVGGWQLEWIGVDASGNDLFLFSPASADLTSLTVDPSTVVGGGASTGTVALSAGAPTGGASVTLTSGNAGVVVPASVT